ncbi:hypothetical protein [Halomonas sp. AOP42-E1-30]|uniref:hypothetical protein n=1 Tax=Halomonas sp. AOP42-E1-30 TaxID=3457665 RepID=UPI004034A76F
MTATNPPIDTVGNMAFELWEKGTPVNSAYPDEERNLGNAPLVPLYDGDSIANVLKVLPDGAEATYSTEITPKNRTTKRLVSAKTVGVMAVAGRVTDPAINIPGAHISGNETLYAGGRLANASQVILTVGWKNASRIFEATGIPSVAVLEEHHLSGTVSGGSGKNLIDTALRLRDTLPANTSITLALSDDRTPATRKAKRNADAVARQTAEEASRHENSKQWKREEAQAEAEKALTQAVTITMFDAANYAANQIKARLVVLK